MDKLKTANRELFNTPILFLIFNRPDLTRIVFERIREVKPKYFYVAADGPRKDHSEDANKCSLAREIVLKNIDWKCEVKTLFREKNLGCGLAVSEAITWFFEHVEEGIILEDDIIPDITFLSYCKNLLNRYRSDNRVMMISGFNINGSWYPEKQSYYFSYFGGVWGWATWRRAWRGYDLKIRKWDDREIQKYILNFFPGYSQSRKNLYNDIRKGAIDTWDIQWGFHRLLNKGLCILPSKNLVQNIGFNEEATHTKAKPVWHHQKLFKMQFPMNHSAVENDKEYDKIHLRRTGNGNKVFKFDMKGIRNHLARLLK